MHMDSLMPTLTAAVLAILLIGLLMHKLRQPQVVAYLLAGVVLGPHGFALITNPSDLTHLSSIGVLLLLFFIGMEISLPRLLANWRVAVIGTLLQIIITTAIVVLLGYWLNWPFPRSILLGFVVSLSSTAVVIKILQGWKEIDSEVGSNVVGVLLIQDLAIVPMMIIINSLGGGEPNIQELSLQVIGGLGIMLLLAWVITKKTFHMPFGKWLKKDHELQVFSALVLCFGMALITGLFSLSSALGAFVAGILISAARETKWVHQRLEPFHVVFVAVFFVSIGMLVDFNFLKDHIFVIFVLVALSFILNTLINAVIMRLLGVDWRNSWYAGALLSQIGEFSFVLAAVGIQAAIITQFGYQITILVISLSLFVSPFWIAIIKKIVFDKNATTAQKQKL